MKARFPKMTIAIRVTLALVMLAFVLPACGTKAPEAPETIKIGTVTDQTGPLAAFGVQTKWGYSKAADDINAEGGIYVSEYDKKIPVEILWGITRQTNRKL
jgi:branched-chain amino acid transport system substrate-binding protein